MVVGSCRQHLIEFVEQRQKTLAKDLMRATEAAPARERIELQIFRLDGQAGCDVVANSLKPAKLIGTEICAGALLRGEPRGEARLDLGAAGFKLRLLFEGETHQVDQVGGNASVRLHRERARRQCAHRRAIAGRG